MNKEEVILIFILDILISFLIAYFLGSRRKIGFGWSFFFSIFPHPIIGLIITLLSQKINNKT